MALTPLDIHHKEFRTARFGGYNEEEVDSFLDLVADEFERLVQENSDVLQQMEQLRQRLAEFEEMQTSLQSALLAASKSAEMIKEQANQESESIMSKAQDEADSVIRSAQEQARQTNMSAQNERQKLERSFAKLKDIKRKYVQSIKDIADSHLAQVAEIEAADPMQDPAEQEAMDDLSKAAADADTAAPPVTGAAPAPPPAETRAQPTQAQAPSAQPTAAPKRTEDAPEQPTDRERGLTPPPVMEEDRNVKGPAPEAAAVAPAPTATGPPEAEKEAMPPSSNLVEEVLSAEADDSIYGDTGDEGSGDESGEKNRRAVRRDKKEKHFFWE